MSIILSNVNSSRLWLLVTGILLALPGICAAIDLPPSPPGYAWREVKPLKAAFLVPDGWEFDADKVDDRYRCTIMKDQDEDGRPSSSMTIVVLGQKDDRELEERYLPSRFAALLFAEIRKNRDIERAQAASQGPFETIRYQYASHPGSARLLREYSLLVANDLTGTLYVFTFTAPLATWENDWQVASIIFDTIILDDEI